MKKILGILGVAALSMLSSTAMAEKKPEWVSDPRCLDSAIANCDKQPFRCRWGWSSRADRSLPEEKHVLFFRDGCGPDDCSKLPRAELVGFCDSIKPPPASLPDSGGVASVPAPSIGTERALKVLEAPSFEQRGGQKAPSSLQGK